MTDNRPEPALADQIAAAIDWWREAGVDRDFTDDATSWLAEPEAETQEGKPAAAPRRVEAAPPPIPEKKIAKIGGERALWPSDLAGFRGWWLSEPTIDAGGLTPRIPPRGEEKPALMVLVPEPEADDRETLLSGPHGGLLAAMLGAMGVAPDAAYVASALPRHTPVPDWEHMRQAGLGDILAHHIALVRPERLLVLGRNIPSLLGHDAAQETAPYTKFEQESQTVPVLVAPGLAQQLRRGTERERLWRLWLDWTDGTR